MATHPLITVASRAARSAGRVLLRHVDKLDDSQLTLERRLILAGRAMRKVQEDLAQNINDLYPAHTLYFNGAPLPDSEPNPQDRWHINAIDGYQNFMRGLPHYAITLAYQFEGKTRIALVYDPILDETFTAVQGDGALMNQKRIRVCSQTKAVAGAMVSMTSDSSSPHAAHRQLVSADACLRASGSPSLDIAYVACARLDAFCGQSNIPANLEAALLIATEARAIVARFDNDQVSLNGKDLMIASGKLQPQLLKTCFNRTSTGTGGNSGPAHES